MTSSKWYVAVISVAALLAGCLSNEKKKNAVKFPQETVDKKKPSVMENSETAFEPYRPVSAHQAQRANSASVEDISQANLSSSTALSNGKGSATITVPDLQKTFSRSSFDILLPLQDSENRFLFNQLGARRFDGRNIVNLGIGQRHFHQDWMLGYNSFYDLQVSRNHHQRLGLGLELWHRNLKLTANGYLRLSGWKSAYLHNGYEERVANGFDINLDAYLPEHPQLGGRVKYEQYRGGEVAPTNKDEHFKNPSALTVGLTYNPIPLLTFGLDRSHWSNGRSEGKANMMINYRFNMPLSKQLDPQYVTGTRNIEGSRFNPVERNNNIILEFKNQKTLYFRLPTELTGAEHERHPISFDFSQQFILDHIDWEDSSLRAHGGQVINVSKHHYHVQLPAYDARSTNYYVLSAVAYDTQGDASNRSTMIIRVEPASVVDTAGNPFDPAPGDDSPRNQLISPRTSSVDDDNESDAPAAPVINTKTVARASDETLPGQDSALLDNELDIAKGESRDAPSTLAAARHSPDAPSTEEAEVSMEDGSNTLFTENFIQPLLNTPPENKNTAARASVPPPPPPPPTAEVQLRPLSQVGSGDSLSNVTLRKPQPKADNQASKNNFQNELANALNKRNSTLKNWGSDTASDISTSSPPSSTPVTPPSSPDKRYDSTPSSSPMPLTLPTSGSSSSSDSDFMDEVVLRRPPPVAATRTLPVELQIPSAVTATSLSAGNSGVLQPANSVSAPLPAVSAPDISFSPPPPPTERDLSPPTSPGEINNLKNKDIREGQMTRHSSAHNATVRIPADELALKRNSLKRVPEDRKNLYKNECRSEMGTYSTLRRSIMKFDASDVESDNSDSSDWE
ncbi:inverse autotransporter beta domain-containing protein [Martelella alba]|uniref:Inverse autotransporter beta-domain domain-containing protein n=1 Tax=Martelella alba TaxID=2590451 RepID=A0ABY2SHS3_9HYPH|nr:inverse autotransporter beta domain-containing protein [Martelella alba]TKI04269.1 hypothetical protein FCN80_18845 [Martelella alba]